MKRQTGKFVKQGREKDGNDRRI